MVDVRVTFRQLTVERDPVLLQGRERRWRWPWVIAGMIVAGVVVVSLYIAAIELPIAEDMQVWFSFVSDADDGPRLDLNPRDPYTFALWLVVFVPFLVAALFTLRFVHGVPWRRAFSYGKGFRWGQFVRAAMAYFVLATAFIGWSYYWAPERFQFRTQFLGPEHLPWFVLGLAVIFVQALSEEVFFKGYLLRVWGAILPFRLPIATAVIIVFALAHLSGSLGVHPGLRLAYIAAGEAVSLVVFFRTQNLAASAGLHWMHNVYMSLLVGPEHTTTEMALGFYRTGDPAALGGLLEHRVYLSLLLSLGLLLALLTWRRSPFYLPKTPEPPTLVEKAAANYN